MPETADAIDCASENTPCSSPSKKCFGGLLSSIS